MYMQIQAVIVSNMVDLGIYLIPVQPVNCFPSKLIPVKFSPFSWPSKTLCLFLALPLAHTSQSLKLLFCQSNIPFVF